MVKLSIIVLSYNTKDLTVRCIKSIINQYKNQLENEEFEIIVVDNASSDASASEISNITRSASHSTVSSDRIGSGQISNIKLIKNKENLGFSKGNNVGAKAAKGKYLFFLNSDTEVLDNGFLKMIDFLEKNEDFGVLGARLKNIDGSNQKSVGKYYSLGNVFLMLFGGERFGLLRSSPKNQAIVDWVSGAAMMIRNDLFEKLNGFDEKLFMYMDDMELCFRVKSNGRKIGFYPDINIMHAERGSSNRTFAIVSIYKGLLYFYKKHKDYLQYSLVKLLLITKASIAIIIGVMTRNIYLKDTYKKALRF